MSVSVLVLTLNEESNLPGCLESVAWSDDIVVLDSFSTDSTVGIAEQAGARVIQRQFDNWAAHQNWALATINFKNKWVFYIDADERMTPALRDEICSIAEREERRVAFYCPRQNMFMGKWIRHAMPPGMIMRFFRPGYLRFERLVNPTASMTGPHGYLTNYLIHYNFSKGLTEWFDKHNKYSLLEAIEGHKSMAEKAPVVQAFFSRDPAARRRSLKAVAFRLPGRPLLKFFYLYLFKGGIRDGAAGLTYCMLQSVYEYMIVVKMNELRRREAGLPI
jgi:glycosyltransferase involved in cell wall biosynthesis